MDPFPFETNTQVFIVRIWPEPRDSTAAVPEWRGVIEHAPSRARRYLRDLNVIPEFIAPYLEQIGMRFNWQWRLRQWLNRLLT